jgi:hypothetical protein
MPVKLLTLNMKSTAGRSLLDPNGARLAREHGKVWRTRRGSRFLA